MDLYTTSFTVPHQKAHTIRTTSPTSFVLPLPGSTGPPEIPLPSVTSTSTHLAKAPSNGFTSSAEDDWDRVQKLALEITTREGCLVTVTREQAGVDVGTAPALSLGTGSADSGQASPAWNFHLSGRYQAAMAARGAVLREYPRDNRFVLKVPRADLFEKPLASTSILKADVKRRLDDVAVETKAHISVIGVESPGGANVGGQVLAVSSGTAASKIPKGSNGHAKTSSGGSTKSATSLGGRSEARSAADDKTGTASSSTLVTYGLETERMCEIIITGELEGVEVAKIRVLVMLDELSGLHSEICDIDYKLHAIIAGRKRCVIQSIQEETATNIYYPTPLVGILNRPQAGTSSHQGYRSMGNGVGPPMSVSMQSTGMTGMGLASQTTGHSYGTSVGMGASMSSGPGSGSGFQNNWGMGPQMTGSVGQINGYGPHGRQHSGPIYNPHHHVQYPYHPQPLDLHSQGMRSVQYATPGSGQGVSPQHLGAGHEYGHEHGHGTASPISMQHTGLSSMTGYPSHHGISSPGQNPSRSGSAHSAGQHYQHQHHQHQHQHHQHLQHHHQQFPIGNHYVPGHSQSSAYQPSPAGFNPYANGQTHVHVGLGSGHAGNTNGLNPGLSTGDGMGMGGNGSGMGGHPQPHSHSPMPGHFGHGPHPGLSVHGGEQGALGTANQIWITGEFFGVQRARDMLLNVAMQKSRLVISRDTAILPRKLDWLLTDRLDDVKAIMADNGTYMQVPPVGSQASLITVFGDHRVNIERTIRSIMTLACQFYVASFWLLPVAFDVLMPQPSLNPAQSVLKRIAHSTGAEVVFKSNCFEMHGLEAQVRAAVLAILELDIIRNFHHEIRFQIELANEHRDFISGKKNGKINKIMKMAGVRIKFETYNDYNFLMDVAGSDIGALQGLSLLQEELPAEMSFHVPESYHKRIIGVGGKNIQRIMKLYGVYVKFSNAEEFAALGGYADNDDNVVARTPAKNSVNLESLRQSVMELVSPKDKDYTTEAVSIPRRYHRDLLGEKSIFIHDIENKTNSSIRFPYKDSASDIVSIFGPESQVHIAAAMLLDHVPFEADLHIPPNAELTTVVSSPDFIHFTERIKRDHQIAISPSAKFGQGDEAVFKLRCQRSNVDFLSTARDALEEFLGQRNIQIYPAHAHKRVDTFADALLQFNSKLLSTRSHAAAKKVADGADSANGATSHLHDVKALFERPGSSDIHGQHDDLASRGFAGPLSFHDPRRVTEIWQSPQAAPSSVQPTRSDTEHSKRDSDPIIQDRMRQATMGPGVPLGPSHGHGHGHGQSRGAAARTQSLDITSLNFSRALTGGTGGPFGALPAASPAAIGSSPKANPGGYFPSPPQPTSGSLAPAGAAAASGQKISGARFDGGVDSVTAGLGNLNV